MDSQNSECDYTVNHRSALCAIYEWAVPEKFCPPHRGGWISRLFMVKFSPGFPGFFEQKILFFTQISRRNSHRCSKSTPLMFSHSGFPGKFCKGASGIPDFLAYVTMTSSMGVPAKFCKEASGIPDFLHT